MKIKALVSIISFILSINYSLAAERLELIIEADNIIDMPSYVRLITYLEAMPAIETVIVDNMSIDHLSMRVQLGGSYNLFLDSVLRDEVIRITTEGTLNELKNTRSIMVSLIPELDDSEE